MTEDFSNLKKEFDNLQTHYKNTLSIVKYII